MAENQVSSTFSNFFTQNEASNESIRALLSAQSDSLKNIERMLSNYSQSSLQDARNSSANWRSVGRESRQTDDYFDSRRFRSRSNSIGDEFLDGIESALSEAFGVDKVRGVLDGALSELSDGLGVAMEDLPNRLGESLAESALDAFKSSDFGRRLVQRLEEGQERYLANANRYFEDMGRRLRGESSSSFTDPAQIFTDIFDDLNSNFGGLGDRIRDSRIGNLASQGLGRFAETGAGRALAGVGTRIAGSAMGSAAAGLASTAIGAAGGPVGIAISLALPLIVDLLGHIANVVLGDILKDLGELKKSWGEFTEALGNSANRDRATRKKQIEEGNKRLQKDLETIVSQPYKILEQATDEMIQAWNEGIRTINQTQGYSKDELQSLIGQFASRIKSEGLESMISSADLTTNLTNVLKAGLSGSAAEEFAYLATKLNAAIPTQDFFQYANSYAALAANQIKAGKSQTDAIAYANQQLELFASDIVYASRQLTGGFATGLQNSSDLFQKAIDISVAARTNNPSDIAGVLTSVSAITGAIAPDLANSMVDAIYNAATGGNSSSIVALRSLAGINASNTEFLQQFAANPRKIFSDLFNKLSEMQHMSESNYMEVAEGLSNVFGLDMAAFARIDFNYLANAIDNMTVSTAALDENMQQLASGESTLNAEQMKIRQINEYMMNEGLAYVLDNEAARAIQQHMWDEQIALELQEATYSVELKGAALNFLNDLRNLVEDIFSFLNPIRGLVKLFNLGRTAIEALSDDGRVRQVLEAGKIGKGNAKILQQMTTYGKQLRLTNTLLSSLQNNVSKGSAGYGWGTLSKSAYTSLGSSATGGNAAQTAGVFKASSKSSSVNISKLEQSVNRMFKTMSDFFSSTVDKKVEAEIEKETNKQTRLALSQISSSKINKLVKEYLNNPDKYGISKIVYDSKLANASKASGLSGFNAEVQARLNDRVREKVVKDLELAAKNEAQELAFSKVMDLVNSGKFGKSGYEAWAATSNKFGISDLDTAFSELGYEIADVKGYFDNLENQQSVQAEIKRNKDEEKFWSETQRLLELANTNIYDVFDKGDVMGIFWPGMDAWLSDIDSNGTSGTVIQGVSGVGFRSEVVGSLFYIHKAFTDFVTNDWEKFFGVGGSGSGTWYDYYVRHTTYTQHLTDSDDGKTLLQTLDDVKKEKDRTTEDVLNALVEALLNNPVGDLLDPTVQQNMFLAAILNAVQTIVQQNNTQGKLKLPDAIAALATGMTSVDTSAAGSPGVTGTSTSTPGSTVAKIGSTISTAGKVASAVASLI